MAKYYKDMRQGTVNHRRITSIVKCVIDYEVFKARELKRRDDSGDGLDEVEQQKRYCLLPGIEFENTDGIMREYVTINKEFLLLVGYDNNLKGFLADYFGRDFRYKTGDPLRFRYLEGYLLNPTIVE